LVFGAADAASFECKLDTGEWAACASPRDYHALGDGEHTFRARAIDAAGNVEAEAAVYAWTVDTTAPDTTITDGPPQLAKSSAAGFAFGAAGVVSFECKLDAGEWVACASPQEYAGLTDGEHRFQVRATDAAGNVEAEPAVHVWSVETVVADTTAPETTLAERPADPSNSSSAGFAFTGSDTQTPASSIGFQCRLDAQAFGSCSSPVGYSGLSEGAHSFEVRAVDGAGNVDPTPAAYTWTVDTVAPQTTISEGPPATTASASARFEFAASEPGSSFECSLDGAAFSTCSSPHAYTGLAAGQHELRVQATDAAGNADATPASRTWTVDTAAPQTTITEGPPSTTTSTSARFAFAASEPGSSFECSLDGAAFSACTSPREYTGLAVGGHQFSVRAKDPVGNVDASPAGQGWTITAPSQGCGPAVTATTAADAWIDENSPSNNKGSDSILKVQSKGPRDNFRALVRFSVPSVPQGCEVETATLRLFAASARTGRTLHALRLTGPWSENQVTWGNQPQTTGAAAPTPSRLGYTEWNVSALVQAMYADGNHGFLIRDAVEGADAEQQFHSREKGENPPQLVLRFAPATP
jgi:large repetitive protein